MGRPGIDPDISFLCTRVTEITKDNEAKLRRVLQYLKHAIDDKSIMGKDGLRQICTWIDATYGLHHDLKIHTSGCM